MEQSLETEINTFLNEKKDIYNQPGKGKKQCKCGAYIGARNTTCPICNEPYEKREVKKEYGKRPARYFGGRITLTPAGECPIKCKELTPDSISDWCELVLESGKEFTTYSYEAMIYWLREFWSISSPEYKIAKQYVIDWNTSCETLAKTQREELNLQDNQNVTYVEKNWSSLESLLET